MFQVSCPSGKFLLFFNYESICQNVWLIIFFSHSRFIVLFTVERFLVVYFPFRRASVSRNKVWVIMTLIFSMLLYSFNFFTSGLENTGDNQVACVTLVRWFDFVRTMVLVDTTITMIIPFIVITFFNFLIMIKLMPCCSNRGKLKPIKLKDKQRSTELDRLSGKSYSTTEMSHVCTTSLISQNMAKPIENRSSSRLSNSISKFKKRSSIQHQHQQQQQQQQQSSGADSVVDVSSITYNQSSKSFRNSQSSTRLHKLLSRMDQTKRKKTYNKTTRTLLTISTSFLLLNTPIALSKFSYFIKSLYETANQLEDKSILSSMSTNASSAFELHMNHTTHGAQLYLASEIASSPAISTTNTMNINYREEIIERISCYLYYINFSLNFFLYNLNGSNFRKTLMDTLKKRYKMEHKKALN
jgi:hypothetical protein